MLASTGSVLLVAFWVLISMALTPNKGLVYDVRGARYGGPLTWPATWFHLGTLSKSHLTYTYLALMMVLVLAYAAAVYLVRNDNSRNATAIIGGFFLVFALMFLVIPMWTSTDVFSYAFYGRSMAIYHANPYILVPAARKADIFYPYAGWHFNASVYGPVFNFISYGITRIAGNSITSNVLGFKALAVACYAGSLPIVFTLTRRVSPGKENFALAVTAWSPLMLMHVVGGGHNDALMVLLVLAAFLMYRKDHALAGLFVMMLAVMVKVSAVLALAPYVVLYVREARTNPLRRLGGAAVVVVLVPVLLYAPFWQGTRIFDSTVRMSKLISFGSVPRLLSSEGQDMLGHLGFSATRAASISNETAQLLFMALFGFLTLYLLTRVKDFRSMIVVSGAIILLWFLTSSYVVPWYLGLGLMVSAIAGWNWLTGTYLATSFVFLLYRVPDASNPRVLGIDRHGAFTYLSWPCLIILVSLLLYGARHTWTRRSEARVTMEEGAAEVTRKA